MIQVQQELNITKYNQSSSRSAQMMILEIVKKANGRKIHLITGQVGDDMSIINGSISVKDYSTLLPMVREKFPNDFIVYKPHPDVESGLRNGFLPKVFVLQYVDFIASQCDINSLLNVVQAVHTITSLSGFEGLIRGKDVYCYGMPFYAGFGLTYDLHQFERRNKVNRTIEELVFITLCLYPRYFIKTLEMFGTPEILTKIINNTKPKTVNSRLQSQFVVLVNAIKMIFESLIKTCKS